MKTLISKMLNRYGFYRKTYMRGRILEKEYRVINRTIRKHSDKDDAWLFALAGHHSHIIDVGSNIGQAAMLMLYHDTIERILVIDPNREALMHAAENLIMNEHSHKAIFINSFVSDIDDDYIEFFTVGTGAAGSKYASHAHTASNTNSSVQVRTKKLDTIVEMVNITPDLIKVDVEGAEVEVLKGASSLSARFKPKFFVEVHSTEGLSIVNNTREILDWCSSNNYVGYYLKTMTDLNMENIKNRGRYHALLVHNDDELPPYLKSISEGDPIRWND